MIRRPHRGARERAAAAVGYRSATPSAASGPRKPNPTAMARRILLLLGVVLLVECCLFVTRSPWLVVRDVRLTGVSSMTPAEASQARALAAMPPNTNLFRANVRLVEARLKRLPFVAQVDVHRRMPPSLDVRIKTRRPAAVLVTSAGSWEIDRGGVVIRARRAGMPLTEILCEYPLDVVPGEDAGPMVDAALTVASFRGLPPRTPVGKIHVDRQANLCLNMVDGIVIRMGQVDQIKDKLALIQRIYQEDPDIAAKVQSIDLSCPEAPACTPRDARAEGTDSPQSSDAQRSASDRRLFKSVSLASQAASSGPTSSVKR